MDKRTTTGTSRFTYYAAAIIGLGGLLYGYNITVVSGAILFIKIQFDVSPALEEFIVSTAVLGALAGAAASGPLADRFGRRSILMVTAGTFALGAILAAFAPDVAWIITGRIIAGISIGMVSVLATLYVAEIAPDRTRGLLVGIYMVLNLGGALVAFVVNGLLAESADWRWMFGLPAFLAIAFGLGVWFLPESPRWCVCNARLDQARAALTRIGRVTNVEQELHRIQSSMQGASANWSALMMPAIRPALLIGIGLGILQRVTGIDTAFFYAPTIFEFVGFKTAALEIWSSVGVATAFVAGQVVNMLLIDRVGRRPLILTGHTGMVVSMVLLGWVFFIADHSAALRWLAVGSLMTLAAFYSLGPGNVAFLLISELYPQQIRGRAMSVATVALWGSYWISTATFLTMTEVLGRSGTFWTYALLGIVALFFVFRFVPETKGKSLEEIQASWR